MTTEYVKGKSVEGDGVLTPSSSNVGSPERRITMGRVSWFDGQNPRGLVPRLGCRCQGLKGSLVVGGLA